MFEHRKRTSVRISSLDVKENAHFPETGVIFYSIDLSRMTIRGQSEKSGKYIEYIGESGNVGLVIELPGSLHQAAPKRQREYLAGRLCAAVALQKIGGPSHVGMEGRIPVWPPGFTGSISHSERKAVAVARRGGGGIGIDCEDWVSSLTAEELAASIFTEREASLKPAGMTSAEFFTLLFSAKEAFYKARSKHLLEIPEFLDVRLVRFENGTIEVRYRELISTIYWKSFPGHCLTMSIVGK